MGWSDFGPGALSILRGEQLLAVEAEVCYSSKCSPRLLRPRRRGGGVMSPEAVLVVTPEVAKSLRRHGHRLALMVKRVLPRGLAKYVCAEAPECQAAEIERMVDKWGGVIVPMHESVEGDLSTYFLIEHVSSHAAEALVSEFRCSPGVRSSYIKPSAVLAGGFEPGPYITFDRARRS
jgi:hypothetical protein